MHGTRVRSCVSTSSQHCSIVIAAGTSIAGDTIFGSFPTFEEAQQAVTARCVGGGSAATVAAAATPTPAVDRSDFISPILAVPKYDDDESTKGIFFVNLDTGNAFYGYWILFAEIGLGGIVPAIILISALLAVCTIPSSRAL